MKQSPVALKPNLLALIRGDGKPDNIEAIRNYLVSEPGTYVLTDKQQEILERLDAADNLIRKDLYGFNTVAKILLNRFKGRDGMPYSIATAKRDIADAMYVYGSTRMRDKGYLLALHIDRILQTTLILTERQEWEMLKGYYAEYTRALALMNEANKAKDNSPVLIFNFGKESFDVLNGKPADMEAIHEITGQVVNDMDEEDKQELSKLL
jgi:hypothetical protein